MNKHIKSISPETLSSFYHRKSVLITGVNGFVAGYLIPRLRGLGAVVHGVDLHEYQKHPECRYHCCNLRNMDSIMQFLKQNPPDCVFHLASQSSVGTSWSNEWQTIQTNVESTYNLFKALEYLEIPVKVLVVSTGEVYGNIGYRKASENDRLMPLNPYAASKAMMEMVVHRYRNSNIDYVIARSYNHTGPRRPATYFEAGIAEKYAVAKLSAKSIVNLKVGNIENIRDFSDVRDVVEKYILLACQGKNGEAYNVCSGIGICLREIITIMEDITNISASIEVDESKLRKNDIPFLVGENCIPIQGRTIRETLKDLYEYYESSILLDQ